MVSPSPLQQQQLEAEAWTHCKHHSERALGWRLSYRAAQNVKHRRRGDIAILPHRVSAVRQCFRGQAYRILDRIEHFRTTGMAYPCRDVSDGQPLIREKAVDLATEVVIGHLGDLAGHHELKATGADVPTHNVDGLRNYPAPGRKDAWTLMRIGARWNPVGTGGDHCGRAVSEQRHTNESGDRGVIALQGKRAQLDRQQ